MTIRVKTNGETLRAYVGRTRVPVDPSGKIDPIEAALAQLRVDCDSDRARLMSDFRWHVAKRADVFGRQEARWQLYLARVHERVEAERAARPPAPKPRDIWGEIYDPSILVTSERGYAL